MFCMECGTKIPNNSKFCMECGWKVPQVENNVVKNEDTYEQEEPINEIDDIEVFNSEEEQEDTSLSFEDSKINPYVSLLDTPTSHSLLEERLKEAQAQIDNNQEDSYEEVLEYGEENDNEKFENNQISSQEECDDLFMQETKIENDNQYMVQNETNVEEDVLDEEIIDDTTNIDNDNVNKIEVVEEPISKVEANIESDENTTSEIENDKEETLNEVDEEDNQSEVKQEENVLEEQKVEEKTSQPSKKEKKPKKQVKFQTILVGFLMVVQMLGIGFSFFATYLFFEEMVAPKFELSNDYLANDVISLYVNPKQFESGSITKEDGKIIGDDGQTKVEYVVVDTLKEQDVPQYIDEQYEKIIGSLDGVYTKGVQEWPNIFNKYYVGSATTDNQYIEIYLIQFSKDKWVMVTTKTKDMIVAGDFFVNGNYISENYIYMKQEKK